MPEVPPEPRSPRRVLLAATGPDWHAIDPGDETDEAIRECRIAESAYVRVLREMLLSDHLLVLAGSGASKCVVLPSGRPGAPGMADLWLRAAAGPTFQSVLDKVHYDAATAGLDIERLLSRCNTYVELNDDAQVTTFIAETERLIAESCRFLRPDDNLAIHQAFLRKIGRRSARLPRTQIFTTNYDQCFEFAASQARFVVIDGFSHTHPQELDGAYFAYDIVRRDRQVDGPDFIANVIQLYKLHGSVDWHLDGGRVVRDATTAQPLLIYPRDSKYRASYAQPFVELMARFQLALRERNAALLVTGFGFRDEHLVEPIIAAIKSNISLRVGVVSPDLDGSDKPIVRMMQELIGRGDSRLSLLSATFEQLVSLLPDLVGETTDEQHLERVRGLGR